jgi:hypothetical protein
VGHVGCCRNSPALLIAVRRILIRLDAGQFLSQLIWPMDEDGQALRTNIELPALEFYGEQWTVLFGRATIQAC